MKLFSIVSLMFVVTSAFAQTQTSTPAVTTATNTVNTAKKITKAKAKKTVKAIKGAKATELKGSATLTKTEIVEVPSVVENKAVESQAVSAPAAGTSVATTTEAKPASKIWSASISSNGSVKPEHYEDVTILTTVSGNVKVADNLKVFAGQTFETLTVGKDLQNDQPAYDVVKENNFRPAFYDIGVSTQTGSIFGSGDSTAKFKYRNTTNDSVMSTLRDYSNSYGYFEATHSIPYTFSPAFSLSIDSHIRHVMTKVDSNSNRIGVLPTLTYAFNDTFSIYQTAGYLLSLRDNNEFRRNYERAVLATGISINAFSGFNIDMNVNQDKAMYINPNAPLDITGFTPYKSTRADVASRTFDDVNYEATMSYNF